MWPNVVKRFCKAQFSCDEDIFDAPNGLFWRLLGATFKIFTLEVILEVEIEH